MLIILTKFLLWNIALLFLLIILMKFIQSRLKALHEAKHGKHVKVLTFIHPNCYDFGGGEKVLWMIIHALTSLGKQNRSLYYKINILSAPKNLIFKNSQNSNNTKTHQQQNHLNTPQEFSYNEDLLAKLSERFSIHLNKRSEAVKEIEIMEFKSAKYLSPFPFCTMILQIIFQMIFAFEVCSRVYSDAVIDTTGLPFAYSILGFLGKYSLGAYIHYPFISDDMIADVKNGKDGVHSRSFLAKFRIYKNVKLLYYSFILKFYAFNSKFLKFIFANSTWTFSHLKNLVPETPNQILYPPCSIGFYQNNFGNDNIRKENVIVSFAQFRPEKNHRMQIDILRKVREQLPNFNVKLWLIGGVRNEDDKILYNGLRNYVNHLGLNEHVEFLPNLPSAEVKRRFLMAKVGIHTMKDEHFGISVIEMMSAGLITIAHDSAGPRKDIIGSAPFQVGLLCQDEKEYIDQIVFVFKNYDKYYSIIQDNCRNWVRKFSDEEFKYNFVKLCREHKILI